METAVPYVKCFHTNELCCSQVSVKNAVPSDVVLDPSEIRLRKMRKVTVLPAVVQCSLVERHHFRCFYLLH